RQARGRAPHRRAHARAAGAVWGRAWASARGSSSSATRRAQRTPRRRRRAGSRTRGRASPPPPRLDVQAIGPEPTPCLCLRELLLGRLRHGFPQQRHHLLLHVDDRVRFRQLLVQPLVLALQPRELVGERVLAHLATALLRRERGELATLALPPPLRQGRRVEALATQ